jgi:hypothetical protein
MQDPETPDEAYERLLRKTRLSDQIEELEGALGKLRLYLLAPAQLMLVIGQLRELRARRIAMGREPDDEANAPADMCCCNVCLQGAPAAQFRDGCPLHPRPELARRDYRLPVTAPQIQAGIAAGTLICHDAGDPDAPHPEELAAMDDLVPELHPAFGLAAGPLLRCGRMRLADCTDDLGSCDDCCARYPDPHGPSLKCGLFSPSECVFEIACDNCEGIPF